MGRLAVPSCCRLGVRVLKWWPESATMCRSPVAPCIRASINRTGGMMPALLIIAAFIALGELWYWATGD